MLPLQARRGTLSAWPRPVCEEAPVKFQTDNVNFSLGTFNCISFASLTVTHTDDRLEQTIQTQKQRANETSRVRDTHREDAGKRETGVGGHGGGGGGGGGGEEGGKSHISGKVVGAWCRL